MIEGRLKLDTWEKDGKKNSKLRVVGERMQMLGGKGGGGGGGGGGGARPRARGAGSDDEAQCGPPADDEMEAGPPDDDIPF